MSGVQVTVPIQLVKHDGEFHLQVRTKSGMEARFSVLNMCSAPTEFNIAGVWASEQFGSALARRRSTGKTDIHGAPLLEGDIVKLSRVYKQGEPCPAMTNHAVVVWDANCAAFVFEGMLENNLPWSSPNLADAGSCTQKVGNVFENADLIPKPVTAGPG
jgi:hypothetical protein